MLAVLKFNEYGQHAIAFERGVKTLFILMVHHVVIMGIKNKCRRRQRGYIEFAGEILVQIQRLILSGTEA